VRRGTAVLWGHLAAAWYCAVCEWSLSSIGRAAALHKWGDALPRFGSERAFAGAQGVQGAAGEDAVFGACSRRQPHSDATRFATLCDWHWIGCALPREDVGAFGVVPRVGIAAWAEAAHDCCIGLGVAGANGKNGSDGKEGIGAVLTSFVLPGEAALPAVRFLGLCCVCLPRALCALPSVVWLCSGLGVRGAVGICAWPVVTAPTQGSPAHGAGVCACRRRWERWSEGRQGRHRRQG
jgi:hypothetical protein